jgi:N-acetylneuraminate synthase
MNPESSLSLSSGGRCLVVGEVAQAHDGSLGMAHAFIDAIANAGADAVKFQTHIASAESTPAEPWRVKFSRQDKTRYDYWKRMEYTEEQWHGLKKHVDERGLLFLSSPFSLEAVELLKRVGVAAWKVASGEISNAPMLDRILAGKLPIILSTGMSPWNELDAAVKKIRKARLDLTVLQCCSIYPTTPDKLGLNLLPELKKRYRCKVGLSDHSGTVFAGLAAAALGADMIEVHVTLSREAFGPDVLASLTTTELRQLVEGTRFIRTALQHPVDKDRMARELAPMRSLFTKSIVARMDLRAGTVLQAKDLTFKKPGTGIPADRFEDVIGRKLARAIKADALITENDLVPAGGIALQACDKSLKKQQARKTTAWRMVRHRS